ncbi:MAG: hypothetical protein LBO66_08585 [Deltaproteobacteria bacterium]|jgi:site-specific recombinase XerD|nr:hypothetical protein [Deltaproteobacteria bacterium]
MSDFDAEWAIASVLKLMEQKGYVRKSVMAVQRAYRDGLQSYLARKGATRATLDDLDAHVREKRALHEAGLLSVDLWKLARRSIEVLKTFVLTGDIETPRVVAWDSAAQTPRLCLARRVPPPERLNAPDDIYAQLWLTRQELLKMGLSEATTRNYTVTGFNAILRAHEELGLKSYSESAISSLIAEARRDFESGRKSRARLTCLLKTSSWLSEWRQTGKLAISGLHRTGQLEPTPAFASLAEAYYAEGAAFRSYAKSFARLVKSVLRSVFFELEDEGFESFEGVTPALFKKIIDTLAIRRKNGASTLISVTRAFCHFLFSTGRVKEDLGQELGLDAGKEKRFRDRFSAEEARALLEAPNRETPEGKRDFAIMLLAARTGATADAIANIKREDINFPSEEIRLPLANARQAVPLALPPDCLKALADYLENGRPPSPLPHLFLYGEADAPTPLDARKISRVVRTHLKKANFSGPKGAGWGYQSLRRTGLP